MTATNKRIEVTKRRESWAAPGPNSVTLKMLTGEIIAPGTLCHHSIAFALVDEGGQAVHSVFTPAAYMKVTVIPFKVGDQGLRVYGEAMAFQEDLNWTTEDDTDTAGYLYEVRYLGYPGDQMYDLVAGAMPNGGGAHNTLAWRLMIVASFSPATGETVWRPEAQPEGARIS